MQQKKEIIKLSGIQEKKNTNSRWESRVRLKTDIQGF